jgi:hypothetical protein
MIEYRIYAPKKGTVADGLPAVIVVANTGSTTSFLTDTQIGEEDYPWVTVVSMPTKEFETKFARTQDDPEAIAKIYREHAQQLGATPEALNFLGRILKPYEKENIVMATSTASVKKGVAKAPGKVITGIKSKVAEPKAAKVAEPKVAKEPKVKAAKEPKVKRPSVSSMICDLIMKGTMSDDQIFAEVQKEFDLDDSKRSYIAWNRNHLKKQGMNPPEPIGGKSTGGAGAKSAPQANKPGLAKTSKVVRPAKPGSKTEASARN